MRGLFASVLAVAGLIVPAVPAASAHQLPGTVDLGPLTTYVQGQVAATVSGNPGIHAAYVRIGRTLADSRLLGFPGDLRRLGVVAKELAGPLAAESTLGSLFQGLMAQARTVLDKYPAFMEEGIDNVDPKQCPLLETMAVNARAKSLAARPSSITHRARLSLCRRGSLDYHRADRRSTR